ncbi:MAG: hypothetical protein ABF665_17335, partial [Gluconacetobacter sp.]
MPADVSPLVVVNHLGPEVGDALARFGDRLHVVAGSREAEAPWDWTTLGTERADILLTGPSRTWKRAPAERPGAWGAGGPRGAGWGEIGSGGGAGVAGWGV